jgi:hypothetical protein
LSSHAVAAPSADVMASTIWEAQLPLFGEASVGGSGGPHKRGQAQRLHVPRVTVALEPALPDSSERRYVITVAGDQGCGIAPPSQDLANLLAATALLGSEQQRAAWACVRELLREQVSQSPAWMTTS